VTIVLKKPVIAVAGSSGKSTTKEMIASILKQKWLIYKSLGNKNNRKDNIYSNPICHFRTYLETIMRLS